VADTNESDHHLFIVRIWSDAARPTPSIRRGSIEHVSSGERRYFLDLVEMQAFVSGHLAELPGTKDAKAKLAEGPSEIS
jgi:hypothetical protein